MAVNGGNIVMVSYGRVYSMITVKFEYYSYRMILKVCLLLCKQMVPGTGGVPQFQRIPLPGTEFLEEEPLYVNAKQYRRILKRRQARAKLEAEGRIPKERPVRIFVIILTTSIIVVGCNDAEV
jgi:hypothetical protein